MNEMQKAISTAAKAQVAWEKNTEYKWQKQPTIVKSETFGTCVTYVACVLQRIGVIEPGSFLWTNGKGFGDGKVIGANKRMTVTYYNNKKTLKDIFKTLQPGDILIFDDNKSGKVGSCGHICIFNGKTYSNGIHTYTGGHIISVNGKEKWTRKPLAVVRINSMPTRKTIDQLAHEVLDGKWGSGDKRKENLINRGYDYDAVQKRVNELLTPSPLIQKMNDWAIKTAKEKYHYVKWKESDTKTHTCPICNNRKFDDHYYGWNCIGWSFAIWHHGGGVKCNCSCHVVADAMKILNAKTDKAAYDEAVKRIGITNIEVIRNGGKSIKSKLKAGDICWTMSDGKIQHTYYFMGNGKYSDSTSGRTDNIQAGNKASDTLLNKTVLAVRLTEEKKYPGKLPTLKLIKTNAQVIQDTIRWALWIAGDNTFHYGYGKEAHHNGCYFCGTEARLKKGKGIVDYEHTYCCNPFIGAAWAHGGCVPAALKLCQNNKSWDFKKGTGYDASPLFDKLGHPAKSKLKAGDVLCRDNHVALYIGNGKIVEASGGDDNVKGSKKWNKSLRTKTLTDANYKNFPRVYRFNSSVNAEMVIRHGEVSDRVKLLQEYLIWKGSDITADGLFGDATLKAVKDFQKAHGLTVDGIVGTATLKAMGGDK